MVKLTAIAIVICVGSVTAALPTGPILRKLDPGFRYQYATDSKREVHLVDLWMSLSDVSHAARYDPASSNVYHLFTRSNPSVSQPLQVNNAGLLSASKFDNNRRTIVLIHGWRDSAISDFNTVLVPVLLATEDVNVIVVDWSTGASSINYRVVIENTIASGAAVAQFIDWLNQVSGSTADQFHIVGHGFGGHQAGIVGRNVNGDVNYVTGLNPALVGWVNHIHRFQPNDGTYTEVIHTNYLIGYPGDLAQVDFYPNGGISMPGCNSNECDDARSFFYFAESVTSGGFTGRRCINYYAALLSLCDSLPGRLQMGGLRPKTGSTGVYLFETNASPPFSQS